MAGSGKHTNTKLPPRFVRLLLARVARLFRTGRRQTALSDELDQFRVTFANAEVGLAHVAPDGRFLLVNHHLCQMLGYSAEQLLQLTFADLTHPEDLAADWALAKELLSGKRCNYSMRKRYFHRNGSVVWISLSVSLVTSATGAPRYFIAAIQDITDQTAAELRLAESVKALAERDAKLQLVFDRASLGDWEWDITADCTYAHPLVFSQYGHPEQNGPVTSDWFISKQHPEDRERIARTLQTALELNDDFDFEFRVLHPDGSVRWLACRGSVIRDAGGKPIRTHGINLDITERKRAEEKAALSAQQLSLLSEVVPQMLWFANAAGDVEFFNRQWYDYTGQCPKNALNWGWQPVIHSDDLSRCLATWRHSLATGCIYEIEYRLKRADGSYRWHLGRALPVRDGGGNIVRWFGSCTDIHALKSAESRLLEFQGQLEQQVSQRTADLQRATELNRRMFDSSPDCIQMLDVRGDLKASNPAGCQAFELGDLPLYWPSIWPEDSRPQAIEAIHAAKEFGQAKFHTLRLSSTGKPVWWDVRITSIPGERDGQLQGLLAVSRDITAEKMAEQALELSQVRLREAQQIAQLGHWEFDVATQEVIWSDQTYRLFGLPEASGITFERYQQLLAPEDVSRLVAAVERAVLTGEPFQLTHRVIWPDGSDRYLEGRGRAEWSANGQVTKLLGTALDVTARVQAALALQESHTKLEQRIADRTRDLREEIEFREATERNLREAEERLALALRFSGVVTWTWDPNSDDTRWGGPVSALYGWPACELNGWAKYQHIIEPEDIPGLSAKIRSCLDHCTDFEAEFRIRRPDGRVRWLVSRGGVFVQDGVLRNMSGINFDITEKKLAEQELAASEARFRQLADGMPQIVWTANPDGEVDYANGAWCSYTGLSLQDIRKWGWKPTLHPDDADRCVAAWTQAFQEGTEYHMEGRIKRAADGEYRWHLGRALPIRGANGRIVKWLGTCPDIHDYKCATAELARLNQDLEARVEHRSAELVESERRHRLMLEGVLDYSIFMLDQHGHVSSWNSGAERINGYTASEIIGKPFSIFYPPEQVATGRPQQELQAAIQIGHYREEGWRLRKDGSRFWANVLITALIDSEGRLNGFSKVIRDLTEQRQTEELLRTAQHRAEEANRAKSQFLATMSHEMRTPMNAILGMAELLWETELNAVQRQYVEIFRRAGGNLLTLVNDILDLTKIESGRFELEHIDFDLRDVVERAIEIIKPKAQAKRLDLVCNIAPNVTAALAGDPIRLQQVLTNLLGNAVKFTEHGSVSISICSASSIPGHLRFEVCDTGIGIPADMLSHIFEDFTQAESSTTRRFGGTGLGLGICRRLVERMGGKLTASSDYGVGSCFAFDAYFGVDMQARTPDLALAHDLGGRRVLVIDDSDTNRLILTEMCEHWGMQTYDCADCSEAFEVLRDASEGQRPFDLVIVDRFIPGCGFEFASETRTLYPALPIIMVTSDEIPGEATRSRDLGLAAYVPKPIRRSEMLRIVCQALTDVHSTSAASSLPDPEPFVAPCKAKLLIAEDSEDNRFLLQAYLNAEPYELTFVDTGKAAVEASVAGIFDLILMDVQMPVMDGLTATRHIRAAGHTELPIIALTANARRDDVDDCKAAGCTEHLAKPITKARLLKTISNHVSSTRNVDVNIPEGFTEPARRYLQSRVKDLAELQCLLASKTFDRIRVIAHNMKGTGQPYGFAPITKLGAQIETAAKKNDATAIADRLQKLTHYVQQASRLVS